MSTIHVLGGAGLNLYQVVVHAGTPGGNNSAGISWATCLVNTGRARSVMTIGNGAGQITQAEYDAIAAGTTVEGTFAWGDNPAWTNQQRQVDLDARATQLIAELQARIAAELRFFGFTRG